jgi:hypothetical protein
MDIGDIIVEGYVLDEDCEISVHIKTLKLLAKIIGDSLIAKEGE